MPDRESFRFRTRVRFVDTDASGRIHFTAMFRYFEAAEVEFFRTLGLTYDSAKDLNFPRVHVECDFLMLISNDDVIDIDVALTNLGRSSIRLEFRTFKGTEPAAKGIVIAVCTDRHSLRSVPIPDNLRATLMAALSPPGTMAD
jgi:YbgC/YbaW family acyl-CoA thioester hydrolase